VVIYLVVVVIYLVVVVVVMYLVVVVMYLVVAVMYLVVVAVTAWTAVMMMRRAVLIAMVTCQMPIAAAAA